MARRKEAPSRLFLPPFRPFSSSSVLPAARPFGFRVCSWRGAGDRVGWCHAPSKSWLARRGACWRRRGVGCSGLGGPASGVLRTRGLGRRRGEEGANSGCYHPGQRGRGTRRPTGAAGRRGSSPGPRRNPARLGDSLWPRVLETGRRSLRSTRPGPDRGARRQSRRGGRPRFACVRPRGRARRLLGPGGELSSVGGRGGAQVRAKPPRRCHPNGRALGDHPGNARGVERRGGWRAPRVRGIARMDGPGQHGPGAGGRGGRLGGALRGARPGRGVDLGVRSSAERCWRPDDRGGDRRGERRAVRRRTSASPRRTGRGAGSGRSGGGGGRGGPALGLGAERRRGRVAGGRAGGCARGSGVPLGDRSLDRPRVRPGPAGRGRTALHASGAERGRERGGNAGRVGGWQGRRRRAEHPGRPAWGRRAVARSLRNRPRAGGLRASDRGRCRGRERFPGRVVRAQGHGHGGRRHLRRAGGGGRFGAGAGADLQRLGPAIVSLCGGGVGRLSGGVARFAEHRRLRDLAAAGRFALGHERDDPDHRRERADVPRGGEPRRRVPGRLAGLSQGDQLAVLRGHLRHPLVRRGPAAGHCRDPHLHPRQHAVVPRRRRERGSVLGRVGRVRPGRKRHPRRPRGGGRRRAGHQRHRHRRRAERAVQAGRGRPGERVPGRVAGPPLGHAAGA